MLEKEKTALDGSFRASKAALVVIDVQNDFCHQEGSISKKKKVDLTHVQRAVATLKTFIQKCRGSDVPIVFVRTTHSAWTDSPSWRARMEGDAEKMEICQPGSWGSDFYEIAPGEGDCIVTKHRYSAFVGTDLDLILRSRGIEYLFFGGVATNVCVETTLRDAFNLNYGVFLVEDCSGAFLPEEHEATLNNIRKYFGRVVTSKISLECRNEAEGEQRGA